MAGYDHKKYWSKAKIRHRGWTEGQIKRLLPEPLSIACDGATLKLWEQSTVQRAEQSPEFQRSRGAGAGEGAGAPDRAAQLAKAAWDRAGKEESTVWRLAGHYHRGILGMMADRKTGKKSKLISSSSAGAWIDDLLTLNRRKIDQEETLLHLRKTLQWAGRNPNHPKARQMLERYAEILLEISRQAVQEFAQRQQPSDLEQMLTRPGFPDQMLVKDGLGVVWSGWYVPQAIRNSLSLLIALNPKDEYPRARSMHRHFILHLGGTNTGKTYAGFQRLIRAKNGVYLAPLRLLALEAQETLLDAGVDCSLTTGEEEDVREEDTHVAATAEKLSLEQHYEVAVIDECQMIADRERGYAWTRAILGVLAPEVHLCAAPEAKEILIQLIESCGDSYEVVEHRRTTPLLCMSHTVDYRRIQPGDALITFSKVGVLSIAEDLRQSGKEPAIIYGALPYATRRKQMEGFLAGKMEYIVSTDAIGMGLNLPIRRIIFMETEKFDGQERRDLKTTEIKQIAGRAGRYGMYNKGYVGATQNLAMIRAGLEAVVPPLEYAVVGFSELVLQVDYDLLEVLTQWNQMPTVKPYRKLDISRYIALISLMRERGFTLTKEQELRAANIPFDEKEEELRKLFFQFLSRWQQGETLEQPGAGDGEDTLPALELYYKKLDLYFSFSKAFGCPVDTDKLYDTREQVAEQINEILLHRLRNNIRFCARCGKPLPLHHRGRLCQDCFRKEQSGPAWLH